MSNPLNPKITPMGTDSASSIASGRADNSLPSPFDARWVGGAQTPLRAPHTAPAEGVSSQTRPFDSKYVSDGSTAVPGQPYGSGRPRRIVLRAKITNA